MIHSVILQLGQLTVRVLVFFLNQTFYERYYGTENILVKDFKVILILMGFLWEKQEMAYL